MQSRHFLLPVSNIYFFRLAKRNKALLAQHLFVSSTILSSKVCSYNFVEKPVIQGFVFQNVIIKQL